MASEHSPRNISHRETGSAVGIPPLSWFTGIVLPGRGIGLVFPSKEFKALGEGEVGKQMIGWSHWTGNPLPKDAEMRTRIQGKITEAEVYIKATTNFTPQEIEERADQLLAEYKGKTEAPFEVILPPTKE